MHELLLIGECSGKSLRTVCIYTGYLFDASGGIMTTEADQFALPGAALQLPEILCLYLIN